MSRAIPDYTTQNREAARIILAHPERYTPAQVEWAELVMKVKEEAEK